MELATQLLGDDATAATISAEVLLGSEEFPIHHLELRSGQKQLTITVFNGGVQIVENLGRTDIEDVSVTP